MDQSYELDVSVENHYLLLYCFVVSPPFAVLKIGDKLTISYSPATLDNVGSSEIGLLLLANSRLPCMRIGVILVVFQVLGDKRKALINN